MRFKNIQPGKLVLALAIVVAGAGCQKMDRPSLADYPKDVNPPGGPLKFYVAFDGTTNNPLMNAVDSIRATFPAENPLTQVDGISGKAVEGVSGKAIKYPSANDFKFSTSFTIAFWLRNEVNSNTEFLFSLQDDTYSGWSYSALFMMMEHATPTEATVKIGVMDQWLEFAGPNKLKRPFFDGNWHHWAMVYDQATSKMSYYFDGQPVTNVPPQITDVKNGDAPRGALDLTKASSLVIGGWNKHAGLPGPGDDWIKSFSGDIDQFRMYGTPLTASEILALFNTQR